MNENMNIPQDSALVKTDVSSSITISKGNRNCNVQITSKSIFFKNEITYKIEDDKILLRIAGIDDNTRVVKPKIDKKNNFYHFYISIDCQEIEFKKYFFDEDESSEDEVVVYYC